MRNDQQIKADFDRDGFVIVPDLFAPDELAELRRMIDGVLDGTVKPDLPVLRGEDPSDFVIQWEPRVRHDPALPRRDKIRVVFHMTHTHTWFLRLARSAKLLDIAEVLIGPNVRHYTDQMFVKPARHGSEVPWHQDAAYWPSVEPRLISFWIAIDDVTVENGCVRFIPGSHRQSLAHDAIVTDNPNNITVRPDLVEAFRAREVPIVMKAGSMAAHHALAVHRSLPNTSDRGRRGLVVIYMPADTKFHQPWPFPYGFPLVRGAPDTRNGQ